MKGGSVKKFILAATALFVTGSLAAAQAAQRSTTAPQAAFKRTAVCHLTSSKTRPYQRVTVSTNAALKAHIAHAGDIIPAPASCPRTLLTANAGGVAIAVNLLGVAEAPDLGDPNGTGTATLRLRQGQAQVCYAINVTEIALPATGAHIHRGAVDSSGAVVVPLGTPGASGSATGCAKSTRSMVNALLKNRTDYYVNVHSTEFPNGALRSQLALPTGTTLLKSTAMTGANERPGPGDTDGAGMGAFMFNPDKGRLCYTLFARNITLPATGAHIHRGAADASGPVVIPFTNPTAAGTSSGCVTVDAALLREVQQNPAGFYSNIHSSEFSGGAVRQQLSAS
jgi:hypothetical protein